MADVLRPASRAQRRATRIDDPAVILRMLREDRLAAAYPLGDTDRLGRPHGEWFLSQTPFAIASFNRLAHGVTCFAAGEPVGLANILDTVRTPADLYFTGSRELAEVIHDRYGSGSSETMIRMAVTAANFRPVGSAERLTADDVDAVNRLYRLGSGGQVVRSHMANGIYYGIRDEGRVVAVAGTHFISETDQIASVGNVFTHPAYRGRGFATRVTSAVTRELLGQVRDVVLNVSATNPPAIAAYKNLGYREYSRFVELFASRQRRGIVGWIREFLRNAFNGD